MDAATEDAILAVLHRLAAAGRCVIAVHHDLATVPRAFDHALLLNREVIAAGPAAAVLSPDNLARAYGRRLAAEG